MSPGAMVISLDFELRWGIRERCPADGGNLRGRLLGARAAVPRILELFDEYGVAATWATVGFLFARSREELERFSPGCRPAYADPSLSPYNDLIGPGEAEDPLHYAPTLVAAIFHSPRQEVATHTYCHYFCCEAGQTEDQFRADIESAHAIADHHGVVLRSIVFPRNQHNPAYDGVLLASGITAYRGNPASGMWKPGSRDRANALGRKVARLVDSYVDLSGDGTIAWSDVLRPSGLADVRASAFLRPCTEARWTRLDRLRLRRITGSLRAAARAGRIYHLWWHPHNFGMQTERNLEFLRNVLEEFHECQERYGMCSLSMAEVAAMARARDRTMGSITTSDCLPRRG